MAEPILRWAGSKRKLMPLLTAAAPKDFSRYVEPFVGSAVLFLGLDAPGALLGDLNADLIDAYKTIREHPRAVWNRLSKMSHAADFYYQLRSKSADTLNDLDRAARFVYLNRFCFNGVYRTNKSGSFNVPRGSGKLSIPELPIFMSFAKALQRADLQCVDFAALVNRTKAGDFLYLDPPYALGEKKDRGEYGPGSFRERDEERLIDAITSASNRGVKVLLSYSPSTFVIERLPGWHVHKLSVIRSVAGFAGARRTADEILISNYRWRPIDK